MANWRSRLGLLGCCAALVRCKTKVVTGESVLIILLQIFQLHQAAEI